MDITRFDALARIDKRRGLAKTMLEIIEDQDQSLFKRMQDPTHCLHHLLLSVRPITLLEGLGLEDTPTFCLK